MALGMFSFAQVRTLASTATPDNEEQVIERALERIVALRNAGRRAESRE